MEKRKSLRKDELVSKLQRKSSLVKMAMIASCVVLFAFTLGGSQFPTDPDTGNAQYQEVVTVTGVKSAELYDRGIAWINKFYVNPNGVMKKQDKAGGLIDGKARFKLKSFDKKGTLQNTGGFVAYQLALEFKDEKFRYTIDRIRWEQPSYYDVTKWADSTQSNYDRKLFDSYIEQTTQYFDSLTNELTSYVKIGVPVKKDEW